MSGSGGIGELGAHGYGKCGVRLLAIPGDVAEVGLKDITVSVSLSGGAEAAYLAGDNAHMVTTDGQRNLVTEVASRMSREPVEDMALAMLGELARCYPFVPLIEVTLEERPWTPIAAGAAGPGHAGPGHAGPGHGGAAFGLDTGERQVVHASSRDGEVRLWQGIAGLTLLLSSGSRFEGFLVDRYTTNVAHHDRPAAGQLAARWRIDGDPADRAGARGLVRRSLLEAFATEPSNSLQHLLTAMGRRALASNEAVAEIELELRSIQLAPVDPRFGPVGGDRLFDVVEAPYGELRVCVERQAPPR